MQCQLQTCFLAGMRLLLCGSCLLGLLLLQVPLQLLQLAAPLHPIAPAPHFQQLVPTLQADFARPHNLRNAKFGQHPLHCDCLHHMPTVIVEFGILRLTKLL